MTLAAAGRTLVRELDWQARAGERWCVIGRNAAGKSTLLRALAGLPVPHRERRRCAGSAGRQADWPAADAARAARLRAAAVERPLPDQRAAPARIGRLRARRATTPRALLAALDAGPLAERDVMRLSGGERQRVALAQCAVQGAPLMLLDEPVAFQDPAHQLQVARWLATLHRALRS